MRSGELLECPDCGCILWKRSGGRSKRYELFVPADAYLRGHLAEFRNGDRSRRIAAPILGGMIYLLLISTLISGITESPFWAVFLTVMAGASAEMLIIAELSSRLFLAKGGERRFGLGTLFLGVTGVSIYLAAIGFVVRSATGGNAVLEVRGLLVLSCVALVFAGISTIVLAYLAESLVAIGYWIVQRIRIRQWQRWRVRQQPSPSDGSGEKSMSDQREREDQTSAN